VLTVYRRHRKKCNFRDDRVSKKCRCTLWATGTLEGKPYRRSLKTRSFERAQSIIREIESGPHEAPKKIITLDHALKAFIVDCETRHLSDATLRKYRLLKATLQGYARHQNISDIHSCTPDALRGFRASRDIGARTAAKELERLRAFFRFCVENGWLDKNPATNLKAPQVKINPRIPFDEQEVQNITAQAKDARELAFILTLRHTGLRIGDASLLRTSQFTENRIHLYTTKAGTPVSLLIPDNLAALLKSIPPRGGYFFVRAESTSMHTCADLWRRRIKILCKQAGVFPDHPHRFRHSLAADLLMKGASVEDVAAILGNSPAIVIKHYSQWIRGRQDRLDSFLQKTWQKPKLQRVK
jgi:integrase/recombinase XerD